MAPRSQQTRSQSLPSSSTSSLDHNATQPTQPTRESRIQALEAHLFSEGERASRLGVQLASPGAVKNIQWSIVSRKSTHSPSHLLPLEILGEVFVYSSCQDELAPLTISHVCKAWRSTVESTPRAWCNLHIRLHRSQSAKLAVKWFQNSKACPLHVALCDPPKLPGSEFWQTIATVSSLLQENWPRVRVFRMYRMVGSVARKILQGCRPHQSSILDSPSSSQLSSVSSSSSQTSSMYPSSIVRHIALNLLQPYHDGEDAGDAGDFRDLYDLFGPTPSLTTFRFDRCVPSFELPLFTTSANNLKSIEIDEPFCNGYTTPLGKVFTILASCPQLQVFLLAGNQNGGLNVMEGHHSPSPVRDVDGNNVESVILPHLRMLSLQSVDIPFVLDHIVCPVLEKLKLGNDLDAYWHGSIADSLRSLITRSNNPPLSRLRINDISTPSPTAVDEWACFDALPNVSSFRVFASAFPDALLKQLTISSEDKEAKKVICPFLNKIVFEDCQFSGDSLVEFVRSRKDGAGGLAAPLSDMWIGTCANVTSDHHAQLKELVGDVFKIMTDERALEA